ncbi:MAG: hypothetical protein ACJ79R_14775 [Anaeromyxobacteraceae bacterium]
MAPTLLVALLLAASPAPAEALAVADAAPQRATTLLIQPFLLIPRDRDGIERWDVDVSAERRLGGPFSAVLQGTFSHQWRGSLSTTVYTVGTQVRAYVFGTFDSGASVAVEVQGVGYPDGGGVTGARGLSLAALAGWKYALAQGFTVDWQVGRGDIVAQSRPGAFYRSGLVSRLGMGWTF